MLTQKKNAKGSIYFIDANNTIVSKICTKCDEVKTLSDFGSRKAGLGGKDATCKACAVKRSIIHYEANKESVLERARNQRETERQRKEQELGLIASWQGLEGKRNRNNVVYYEDFNGDVLAKVCTTCNDVRPIENYAVSKLGLGGRVSDCKTCRITWYTDNKESEVERISAWQRDNPDKCVLSQQRRRARKKSLSNDFTSEQMAETFDFFGGCALTGATTDIHWDHVIPLATGFGGTTFGNMIPLRGDLNTSKNDANVFEWFERNKERFNLAQSSFDSLVEWLASVNGMTTAEYHSFVDECFDNRRKEAI
jgi:hypothetical protein